MESDRWQRLTELFHQALDVDGGRRRAFLDEACGDDASLRAELESLLSYHDRTDQMLDTSLALDGVEGASLAGDSLVGRSLNQYRVTRRLGAGGMGVVYLADDTRLGRPVALKVLARRFSEDVTRRERLRREARMAAALSHPSIATVYALEEVDDTLFIVSEYVDGPTLRDELGQLSTPVLLDSGLEIARALAAAHDRGVVHRDLKPDNVIRTVAGGVKVLDFGLAQMVDAGEAADRQGRLTEDGAVLGTPGYMPPEQLRGATVDFRGDLFSFGVLLFELASGVHPFSSATRVSTIAQVLEAQPPDLSGLRPGCPLGLSRIVARCLAKDPNQRFDSTHELVDALDELRRALVSTASPPASSSPASGPSPGAVVREDAASLTPTPLWWWQFHQVGLSLGYVALLIPLWQARLWIPAPWARALFFTALVGVATAATLRLHLWFTSRFYPAELSAQRRRSSPWIAAGDWGLVGVLAAAGVWSMTDHPRYAAAFIGVAVASVVGLTVVEPATTRAALGSLPRR